MNKLIERYIALLDAPVTPENILELAKVREELARCKEVKLAKVKNERLDFLDGKKTWGDIHKPDGAVPGVEVNLLVLDKESVPEVKGLKRYSLGYALDSTRPQEEDNLVKVLDVLSFQDVRAGSITVVKVRGVKPTKSGKLYGVTLNEAPLSLAAVKGKLHSAKEIIRKAFASNVLELDKPTAVELCRLGILSFNIDERFGVGLDKEVKFAKGVNFLKEGIVYGIVYPVNEVDSDGDYATLLEVQKACWRFMEDFQKFNYMHGEDLSARDVALVECACALADVPDLKIKKGDWYIAVKVYKMELRKKIELGEITGFSMEGSAQPGEPIEGMKR